MSTKLNTSQPDSATQRKTWDTVWQGMDVRNRKFYSDKPQSYLQFGTMMSLEYIGETIFPKTDGLRCLECGAGRADFSNYFATKRNYKITCLDISQPGLNLARVNFQKEGNSADFVQGSVTSLPFADGVFDITFCVVLLELFEDVQSVVDEMVRVLKPGGMFFTAILSRKSNIQTLTQRVFQILVAPVVVLRSLHRGEGSGWQKVTRMFQQSYYTNTYSLAQYEEFLKKAGLVDIKSTGFGPFPTPPYRPPWLDRAYLRFVMALTWLGRRLGKNHPWLTSPSWSVFWYVSGRKNG